MIVGRSDERRVLSHVLDEAEDGRAAALLVVGEAGIGKTVLLEATAQEAAARGFRVVEVTGLPGEAAVPGGALTLLAARLETSGVPPDEVARLQTIPSAGMAAPVLLSVLAAASGRQPLLLVVDDAHWWDDLSLSALIFAARRLSLDPVAIVIAGRPRVVESVGLSTFTRLEVGPLPGELAGTLARSAAPDIADGVAHALWTAVDGNTLAVVEAAASLPAHERRGAVPPPSEFPVGPGVVAAWASHVERLAPRTQLALAVLAVDTGDEVLPRALAVAGVSFDDLVPAEAEGLVLTSGLRWRFRHPLVRHAVVAALPASTVRSAHAAACEALAGVAENPQQILRRVQHRAAASVGPDGSLAQETAADAMRIEELGALSAAARAFEIAAAADPDPRRAAVALARAARLALQDFDDGEALRLARHGLALDPPPETRGSLLRLAGVALGRVEDGPAGCRLLRESLTLLDGDERRQAACDLLFTSDLVTDYGEVVGGLVEELDRDEALGPVEVLLVAHARARLSADRAAHEELLDAFENLEPNDVVDSGRSVETFTNAAFDVGLEVSAGLIRATVAALSESGDPRRRLEALGMDLLLGFWDGRWDEQAANLEETRELSEALGRVDLYSDAIALSTYARQGRSDAFCAALERATPIMTRAGLDFWTRCFPGERAILALSLGRADEAMALLAGEVVDMPRHVVGHLVYTDHLVTLVECYADAGRHDDAVEAFDALTAMLGPCPSALGAGFLSRAEAAVSTADDLGPLFDLAEDRIGTGVHVFELAMTRLRHGRWLRRRRRRRAAADTLLLALESFEALSCAGWAEQCRFELHAAGVDVARTARYDPRAQLTAQERRVADEVATGATNDEVARRLFLSPRTVEVHLTHVYRKLGITGRDQLSALDLRDGGDLRVRP